MWRIRKYFPDLTDRQVEKFKLLGELYPYWNERINLISRRDIGNLYERHILHSLAIAKFLPFNPNAWVLDVGTGGGFPGIPLAIVFEKTSFHLIDPIRKKIKAVNAIAKACQLNNVTTFAQRVEELKQRYDFVVSRAVAKILQLIDMCRKNISDIHRHPLQNGLICLKGEGVENELSNRDFSYSVSNCSDFFEEEFFKTKKIVHVSLGTKNKGYEMKYFVR